MMGPEPIIRTFLISFFCFTGTPPFVDNKQGVVAFASSLLFHTLLL
jgi:hypothetical protein